MQSSAQGDREACSSADVAREGRRSWRGALRRLFPAVVLGLAALGYWRLAPASTTLSYELGPHRVGLCSLEVDLLKLPDRELARRAEFLYSQAAPAPLDQVHSLRLERGEYEADVDLGACSGQHRQFRTRFHFTGQEWVSLPVTGP